MSNEKEIKYSYSRLETYEQCSFRYFLKYIEGHYPNTSSIAFDFGTLVHEIEETIGNCIKENKEIPYTELKQHFSEKCLNIERKYPEAFMEKDKSDRTYADKINYYLNKGIYRLENFMKSNPELEIVGCEVPFNFRYNGDQFFRGFIDRILRNKITGQYFVQDIKTYAVPLEHDKLTTPLQFVVYCIAMSEIYPVDPTTIKCSYDLPLCDIIQDAGTPGFIGRGRTKLSKLFEKINEKNWDPKPSPLCHWCEYCSSNSTASDDIKFLCPYMMKWTREAKDFSKENEWTSINEYPIILEAYHKKYNIKDEGK